MSSYSKTLSDPEVCNVFIDSIENFTTVVEVSVEVDVEKVRKK